MCAYTALRAVSCLVSHPREILLYDTLPHDYYWPYMYNHAYTTVADALSCAAQGTITGHWKELRLFPAAGQLGLLGMHILGPFPKTKSGTEHAIYLTERYT